MVKSAATQMSVIVPTMLDLGRIVLNLIFLVLISSLTKNKVAAQCHQLNINSRASGFQPRKQVYLRS
jgi:hypothetical protein